MLASIPTTYKGVRFRSRLEARWACFFDFMQWRWEYEPMDCRGWIPDFALIGRDQTMLVEVKPTAHFLEPIAREMEQAMPADTYALALLGSPLHADDMCASLGWTRCFEPRTTNLWLERDIWKSRIGNKSGPLFDIILESSTVRPMSGFFTRLEFSIQQDNGWTCFEGTEIKQLWVEAGNRVQWRPPADKPRRQSIADWKSQFRSQRW